MSELLRTIATYVPPNIVRATLAESTPSPPTDAMPDRFPAAILFADVSGFTPLTEALAQKGAEGPEELTRLLNGYFSRMITLIEAEGGEVVKFSGDAVTVVFPARSEALGPATRRAWQAAEAMQAAMSDFTTLETSAGPVALGMKIGIGAGEILALQVGGVRDEWEYVIAGDPLRQVAEAEHQAGRGEIILSPEAEAIMAPESIAPCPLPQPDWESIQNPAEVETVLRAYVPDVVTAWLAEELQDWLAVLRPMSVLFIGVAGLDYSQGDAVEKLHHFLRAAQEIIYRYEGSINKLAVDDKGTVLIALFGAPPHAHEDDPERALRCALNLQGMAGKQGLYLAIGVTTGRVFTGPVGSESRREYTVMGDTVNLAARLMAAAGPGQIRCDYETYRWARGKLAFDTLSSVRVKGKAGLIRVYRPTGEIGREREAESQSRLVGRQAEVVRLTTALDEIQLNRHRTQCLIVEGEAGIGKSRLVDELLRLMRERGISGLVGMGRSIEQQTPYRAWRDIFTAYFGLDELDDPAERRHQVEEQVRDIVPDMVERLPLLNDVLSLGLPENELTASLDSHLRHDSLVSLLLALLRAWAAERPLVIVLEDAHWLDSLSWDLTLQVVRALSVARVSLLLVVVMRPLEGDAMRVEPVGLAKMDETETLLLGSLSPEETLTLAASRLDLSGGELPETVAELVRRRAGGNPFFAEELIYALRDTGLITIKIKGDKRHCLVQGDLAQAAQTLPDTIQGIVLSRIDRLPPEEQLALKVAAVIGRTFIFSTLRDTLGEHMEISERLLRTYLDDLVHLDLTPLEAPEPELTYIFKHIITQEVAYETLLFAQRRQLHRTVARWYERKFGDGRERPLPESLESPLASYCPLLVYHWHRAEDRARERHYTTLAGYWAAAQFANAEAVGYFSRALTLTPETDLAARYKLLLAREKVNDLRGEREAQAQDLAGLAALVKSVQDDQWRTEIALRRANYYEEISDYGAALGVVRQAIEQTERARDPAQETEAYIAWGKILWRRGDYEVARWPLEQALARARGTKNHHSEAKSLYYLGHVYLYQGNYPAAQEHYRQALEIYRSDGYRQGEADSLSILGVTYYELGDYPVARDHYEQVLAIFQTIGDQRGETITVSNLGTVYCDLGDYEAARDYHQRAMDIRLMIGDRSGEAISLTNLGLVYHNLSENEAARNYCERALAIQREIGDRHSESYSLTYLGHTLKELGEFQAAAEAYTQAMNLRSELGQHGLTMDDLAGLARVALTQNDLEGATAQVEEILAWIGANGTEGIEYPLQVYLTCYQVLMAKTTHEPSAAERAKALLTQAHAALLERASGISNEVLRGKFLQNVKTNREIMSAWKASKRDEL
jgi:class 3 adenylate cyclase/predicted ATPase